MSNSQTYTAVRVCFDGIPQQQLIYLKGALSRFVSANYGHIMCGDDCGFFFMSLPGQKVDVFRRICEVSGAVTKTRLVSAAFFDKLFEGVPA